MNTKDFVKSLTKEQRLAYESILFDYKNDLLENIKQSIFKLIDNDIDNIEFDRAIKLAIQRIAAEKG